MEQGLVSNHGGKRLTSRDGGDDGGDSGLNVRDQVLQGLKCGCERGHIETGERGGDDSSERGGALGSLEGTGQALKAGDEGRDNVEGATALNSGDWDFC